MAEKIGEEFVRDMIDRGRRELGGVLFPDSNITQPMYPLRGGYGVSKETDSPSLEEHESTLDDRLKQVEVSRDNHEHDDRDRGPDRGSRVALARESPPNPKERVMFTAICVGINIFVTIGLMLLPKGRKKSEGKNEDEHSGPDYPCV
jgi:hypothetical protein